MQQKRTISKCLPLLGLTFCTFVFNTSEFMPIGLLSDIANDLNISDARAGMLISVYAWVVALMSLPLMIIVSKMELKRLLLTIIAVFVLSHVASALAEGYYTLMLSRIGVACSHAIFWSIVSPLAVRIVPDDKRAFALSMVATGSSIAMVVGLPLGRVVGLYLGWRMTFLSIGVISALIFIYIAAMLPKVPSRGKFSVKRLPALLHNRVLLGVFVMSVLFATAHYTGYSYIEPFLKQIAGLSDSRVTVVLTVFGATGIIGSMLFSRFYDRTRFVFMKCILIGIAAAQLLLMAASASFITSAVVCALWGMAITAFNVTFQAETIKAASAEGSTVAMSIYSGIYNLGISVGTWVGGLVCTYVSISYIGIAGGITACAALVFCSLYLVSHLRSCK